MSLVTPNNSFHKVFFASLNLICSGTGRLRNFDDLHHRAADHLRRHRPDLHRSQEPERQGRRPSTHEIIRIEFD